MSTSTITAHDGAGMSIARTAAERARGMPRGKARAHSRLVKVLRVVLPLMMVAVIATLAGLVISHAVRRHGARHQDANTPIRMTNPHFFGRDNQGRAFTIGARQAERDPNSLQVVLLQDPSLTLGAGAPDARSLTADSGVYHEDTRILLLRGHVKASNAANSHFATNEAIVNTRTGQVAGPAALATQTPQGAVKSKSFDVYDKGDRVIFKGGVHAVLKSH
jgi:lipopolysaccharide export system protein LptC